MFKLLSKHLETFEIITNNIQLFKTQISDKIRDLSLNYVEEKDQLVSLQRRASNLFHPHHEVMTNLATWLVPILCRAPGNTFN
jgi:hypothetical protein